VTETTDYFFLGRGLADGATAVSAAAGAPCADCVFWDFLSFFLAMTFCGGRSGTIELADQA
jgi:hypothetical protein